MIRSRAFLYDFCASSQPSNRDFCDLWVVGGGIAMDGSSKGRAVTILQTIIARPAWSRDARRAPRLASPRLRAFRALLPGGLDDAAVLPAVDVLGADHARGGRDGHLDDRVLDDVNVAPMSGLWSKRVPEGVVLVPDRMGLPRAAADARPLVAPGRACAGGEERSPHAVATAFTEGEAAEEDRYVFSRKQQRGFQKQNAGTNNALRYNLVLVN